MSKYPPDTDRYFRWRKLMWRARHTGPRRMVVLARRRVLRPAWFTGLFLSLAGCIAPASGQLPTTVPPTLTPAPVSSAWEPLLPGLERRIYRPTDTLVTRLTALRIDPAQMNLRVHYRPGAPLPVAGWREQLPDAAVILNTNFFDSNDFITGMLFADGVQHGEPYRRRGGTFYVDGGAVGIQSNLVQSYAGEQYDQAAQAFPMLMTSGAQSYFDSRADRASRRTVIAVDTQGRVIVLVTTFGGMTLLELATYLPTTDMNIVDALNLDGGGSSLLDVQAGETRSTFTSFDPVPAVLAVTPR